MRKLLSRFFSFALLAMTLVFAAQPALADWDRHGGYGGYHGGYDHGYHGGYYHHPHFVAIFPIFPPVVYYHSAPVQVSLQCPSGQFITVRGRGVPAEQLLDQAASICASQGPAYGIPPRGAAFNGSGGYCREYQARVIVGGRPQQSYGQACMQPDGSWQIEN